MKHCFKPRTPSMEVAKVHYNQDRALELLSMLQKRLTDLEIDLKEKRSSVFKRSLLWYFSCRD